MDILSHGVWGGLAFGKQQKKRFWTAFLFGVAPDLLSFGIFSGMTVLGLISGPDWSSGPPPAGSIPPFVHTLYDLTHSFIPFLVIFFIVALIRKKPVYEMLAWPLHILMDIPTHSTEFFPTPFFWPILEYRFDGIPWSHPLIFFPNWILLLLGLWYFFVFKKRRKKHLSPKE